MTNEAKPHAFDVFISYSRKNEAFAARLEKALENYRPEKDLKVPQRHIETFRDKEDFTAGDYYKTLLKNLKDSSKLMVICSPEARASRFVDDEIRRFVEIRGAEHIIPILYSGIPNNEARPGQEAMLAFPDALCQAMELPLAINFLDFDPRKDAIGKGIYTGPWYSVLADIYGLGRSDMEQREKRRRARRRRITYAVLSGSLMVLSVLLIFALVSRSRAITARNDANRALLASYIESGRQELEVNSPLRAAVYLNAAYQMPIVDEEPNKRSSLLFLLGRSMRSLEALTFSAAHGDKIYSAEMSRDGKRVITVSRDGTAKVWDVDSGQSLLSLDHGAGVYYTDFLITLSPDGRQVATASENKVGILDIATKGTVATFEYEGTCRSLKFSPDGRHVVAVVDGQPVRIWDVKNKDTLTLAENSASGEAAGFSPDGRRLVVFGNRAVKQWDLETREMRASVPLDLRGDSSFEQLSPDGRSIVTVVDDSVGVWDVETGHNLVSLRPDGLVMSGEVSPDGSRIVTVSSEPDGMVSYKNAIRVWNMRTGELLATFEPNEIFLSAHFVPSGKMLATGNQRRTNIRDAETGEVLVAFEGDFFGGFSADGRRFLTIGDDHTAKVWNLDMMTTLTLSPLEDQGVRSARFTPDGKSILVDCLDDVARVRDSETRRVNASFNYQDLGSIEFSPDGKRAARLRNDQTVQIMNFGSRDALSSFGQKETIGPGPFSPDGRRLATISSEKAVRIWDIESKTVFASFEPGGVIWSADFSPDWKKVVVGYGESRKYRIWDTETQEALGSFEYKGDVRLTKFAPDGGKILTADGGLAVDVRETKTGSILGRLELRNPVRSADFSPDGRRIVTADVENTIKIWATDTGVPLVSFDLRGDIVMPGAGGARAALSPTFSPDGSRILVGTVRAIQIRDVETGRVLNSLAVGKEVESATFSPDGAMVLIVTGSFAADEKRALTWRIASDTRTPDEIKAIVESKVPFRMVNGTLVSR